MELELTQLKSMINKMKIEKLVFKSLKAEELTEELILLKTFIILILWY